ncbi:hypothetical protein [Streptomyces sp. NPDC093223]|uniref:hypothetical protein n=1 Tax=Streptomyces sp. NPDC093223 TaxID=3366033 RepID=UPI00380699D7
MAALAAGITLACLGYLVFLGTLVAGVWRPAATSPPRVEESVVPRPARSPGGVVRRSSGTVPGRSTEARSAGAAGQQAR